MEDTGRVEDQLQYAQEAHEVLTSARHALSPRQVEALATHFGRQESSRQLAKARQQHGQARIGEYNMRHWLAVKNPEVVRCQHKPRCWVAWLWLCCGALTYACVLRPQFIKLQSLYMQKLKLKTWFDFIDADGSGEIDVDELEDPLTSLGLATTHDEVQRLVDAVDDDKSGEIGFEEFVSVITRSTGARNPIKKL